jgi:hypothetical protein
VIFLHSPQKSTNPRTLPSARAPATDLAGIKEPNPAIITAIRTPLNIQVYQSAPGTGTYRPSTASSMPITIPAPT